MDILMSYVYYGTPSIPRIGNFAKSCLGSCTPLTRLVLHYGTHSLRQSWLVHWTDWLLRMVEHTRIDHWYPHVLYIIWRYVYCTLFTIPYARLTSGFGPLWIVVLLITTFLLGENEADLVIDHVEESINHYLVARSKVPRTSESRRSTTWFHTSIFSLHVNVPQSLSITIPYYGYNCEPNQTYFLHTWRRCSDFLQGPNLVSLIAHCIHWYVLFKS